MCVCFVVFVFVFSVETNNFPFGYALFYFFFTPDPIVSRDPLSLRCSIRYPNEVNRLSLGEG